MLICGFGLVLFFVVGFRFRLLLILVRGVFAIMVTTCTRREKEEIPTNSFDNVVNDNIVDINI